MVPTGQGGINGVRHENQKKFAGRFSNGTGKPVKKTKAG